MTGTADLASQYQDLIEQLLEISREEGGIEQDVYYPACQVVEILREKVHSVPKLFAHGPKSIIFTWDTGETVVYLTVSSKSISLLVSTPERIERREQLALEDVPTTLARFIQRST